MHYLAIQSPIIDLILPDYRIFLTQRGANLVVGLTGRRKNQRHKENISFWVSMQKQASKKSLFYSLRIFPIWQIPRRG